MSRDGASVRLDSKARLPLARFIPSGQRGGSYRVTPHGKGRFVLEEVVVLTRSELADLARNSLIPHTPPGETP